jgi:homoserine dehydrogenase
MDWQGVVNYPAVEIVAELAGGTTYGRGAGKELDGAVSPIRDVVCRYFVRLTIVDRPGVLARISAILGAARIGISSVIQPESHEGNNVPLILMLHKAPNGAVTKALASISTLPAVKTRPVVIRVEDFE